MAKIGEVNSSLVWNAKSLPANVATSPLLNSEESTEAEGSGCGYYYLNNGVAREHRHNPRMAKKQNQMQIVRSMKQKSIL